MGKWGVFIQSEGLQLYSYEVNVVLVTLMDTAYNLALLRQIVREHNAHVGLVELARSYRSQMEFAAGAFNIKPDPMGCEREISRIDAVLAQAEGRE